MANNIKFELELANGKFKTAATEAAKAADQISKNLKGVQLPKINTQALMGGFNSLRGGVNKLGSAIFSVKGLIAGLGAGYAIKQFISAANAQEDAVNRLAQGLVASGEATQGNLSEMQAWASELQKTSTIGDETALAMAGLALSMGATKDQSKQIVETAGQMSRALGISVETAVRQLSKSLGGTLGELAELAPELRNFTKEQLQAGAAAEFLGSKLPALEATTFSEKLTQVSNAFGDVLEEIGFAITKNESLRQVLGIVVEGLSQVGAAISANRGTLANFIQVGVNGAIKGFAFLSKAIGSLLVSWSGLKSFVAEVVLFFAKKIKELEGIINRIPGINVSLIDESTFQALEEGASKAADSFLEAYGAMTAVTSEIDLIAQKINDLPPADEFISTDNLADKIASGVSIGATKGFQQAIDKAPSFMTKGFVGPVMPADVAKQRSAKPKQDPEIKRQASNLTKELTASFASGVAQGGEQGATSIITSMTAGIADVFLPGFGGAIGSIVGLLAQGPEKVKETIRSLIEAIPGIVTAIIQSLPVLINELIQGIIANLPAIIKAFIDNFPALIQGLIFAAGPLLQALVLDIPKIIANALINVVKDLFADLGRSFKELFDGLNPFDGGGSGGFLGGVAKKLGFATGGYVTGSGNRDTVPAVLSPGELVVDRTTGPMLREFLKSYTPNQDRGSSQDVQALIRAVSQANSQPIMATITLDGQVISNQILRNNRNNRRVS